MKKELLTMTLAAGFSVLPLFFTGCSTPKGVKTSESAVSSMKDIEDLLKQGDQQISATMTSLNEIVKNVKTDARSSYKAFAADVQNLEKLQADVSSQNEKMKTRADEHYALWDQELQSITNPTLKQQGSERRANVMAEFRSLQESYDGLRIAFRPYLDDLKDLVVYLGTDLNPSGVSAASSMITGLKAQAVSVQNDLKKVTDKISKLRTDISVQQPQPEK